MVGVSDPVASGLVVSLSRPGGNVTGTSGVFSEGAGRRLQFLKEAIPGTRHVAVLWNPDNRVFQTQVLKETEVAARTLGLQLRLFEARDSASIDTAFAAISKEDVGALNVLPDPILAVYYARIAELAVKARLPSVSANSAFAAAGGLMTYGPSIPQLGRGAATYVAKILRGANPADLPIEQPTKFEFVINMKTAKQIGITVPQSLKVSADRLIE
jgi:putative ABC transport system substrate-binding protein